MISDNNKLNQNINCFKILVPAAQHLD